MFSVPFAATLKTPGSTNEPSPFWSLKLTVIFLPAPTLSTEVIVALKPLSWAECSGTTWAFLMPASHSALPWGWWQVAHVPSAAGPATWFAPVVKFRSLWQEPQAATDGYVYQLAPPAAAGSWQVAQLRMSCG